MSRSARWRAVTAAITLVLIVATPAAAASASVPNDAPSERVAQAASVQAAGWYCQDNPERCIGGGGPLVEVLEVGFYIFVGATLISLVGGLLGPLRPSERRKRAQQEAEKQEALAKKRTEAEAEAAQRRTELEQDAANRAAAASWVAGQEDRKPAVRPTESREDQIARWHDEDALRAATDAERRLTHMNDLERERVARASWVTPKLLTRLADDPEFPVRRAVAESASAPPEVLARLAVDYYGLVRRAVARNPAAPSDIRDRADSSF